MVQTTFRTTHEGKPAVCVHTKYSNGTETKRFHEPNNPIPYDVIWVKPKNKGK
jgi:hypothetical protein